VLKVAHKVKEMKLHDCIPDREGNKTANAMKNLPRSGGYTLKHSTVATFNKRMHAFIHGMDDLRETDELEPPDFDFDSTEIAESNDNE
jgi:hypothetical protein